MKKLVKLAVRTGLRRGWRVGVLEGNQTWLVVGGVALVAHLAGRALGREDEIVFSEPLAPGETFRISHVLKP